MLIKTILNHVEKHKSFVYTNVGFETGPSLSSSLIPVSASIPLISAMLIGSVSGSVAEPVKVNGVLTGITKPPVPALTIGALFPVAICTAQPLPKLNVE